MSGPERDDVDLDVGDVGIRLDRQARERDDPARRHQQDHRQGDEPLAQRERDDTIDHVRTVSPCARQTVAGHADASGSDAPPKAALAHWR